MVIITKYSYSDFDYNKKYSLQEFEALAKERNYHYFIPAPRASYYFEEGEIMSSSARKPVTWVTPIS